MNTTQILAKVNSSPADCSISLNSDGSISWRLSAKENKVGWNLGFGEDVSLIELGSDSLQMEANHDHSVAIGYSQYYYD